MRVLRALLFGGAMAACVGSALFQGERPRRDMPAASATGLPPGRWCWRDGDLRPAPPISACPSGSVSFERGVEL